MSNEVVKTNNELIVRIEHINATNRQVADAARTTIGLESGNKEVPDSYMRKMYMCEHSPIRIKEFNIVIENIPYWVAMHLVRHHVGVTPFVSTQRDDRTIDDISRDEKGQGELVTLRIVANAQSIMAMSRKRLCLCASPETRSAWMKVLEEVKKYDLPLYESCVPECIYRGFCPEFYDCSNKGTKRKYSDTEMYRFRLNQYRNFK